MIWWASPRLTDQTSLVETEERDSMRQKGIRVKVEIVVGFGDGCFVRLLLGNH